MTTALTNSFAPKPFTAKDYRNKKQQNSTETEFDYKLTELNASSVETCEICSVFVLSK